MKKLLFVCIAVLSLTACEFIADEDESESSSTGKASAVVTSTESISYTITSNESVYIVPANAASVTLSGEIAGKSVYYVPVNTGSKSVSNEYVRYVTNGSARSVTGAVVHTHKDSADSSESHALVCNHGEDFLPHFESEGLARSISHNENGVAEISYEIGATKKELFVSVDSKNYQRKNATLWACNEACNVWVVDDDAYIAPSNRKALASRYAEKFQTLAPRVRGIFGNEADSLYASASGSTVSMNTASDTRAKVNIVVYDLYNDGTQGSTIGLFSSMDYYKNGLSFSTAVVNRSNEGKYFYIDSYFAVMNFDYTISTLAHEFQHMINFGVKAMKKATSDSNFNEMLSMLCEQFLQNQLGISDEDSPKNRLHRFSSNYYNTGIRGYDNSLQAYANAYAFGSWLAEEFGGEALVSEMMANGKANNDCIVAAVNALSGKSYTFDALFAEFVKDCLDSENGPVVFENEVVTDVAASYGMFLKNYGTVATGTNSLTLNFTSISGMTNSDLLIYIYVK